MHVLPFRLCFQGQDIPDPPYPRPNARAALLVGTRREPVNTLMGGTRARVHVKRENTLKQWEPPTIPPAKIAGQGNILIQKEPPPARVALLEHIRKQRGPQVAKTAKVQPTLRFRDRLPAHPALVGHGPTLTTLAALPT